MEGAAPEELMAVTSEGVAAPREAAALTVVAVKSQLAVTGAAAASAAWASSAARAVMVVAGLGVSAVVAKRQP